MNVRLRMYKYCYSNLGAIYAKGYENKTVGEPHFHMNGLIARRVVLKQRRKTTRKWPTTFQMGLLCWPVHI